jgi:hypothetical protein
LLVLLAALLTAAALLPGWRLAGGAIDRRAERASERRHRELVAAVHRILDERAPR